MVVARVLLFSVVVLLAGPGNSYAQQSDSDSIKAAIAAYHAVIEGLDMSKMDPLWAHRSGRNCAPPVAHLFSHDHATRPGL
jgi:hypothetical protein